MTQQLINWIAGLQNEYAFDGVRIDTVPYVNQTFWCAPKTPVHLSEHYRQSGGLAWSQLATA